MAVAICHVKATKGQPRTLPALPDFFAPHQVPPKQQIARLAHACIDIIVRRRKSRQNVVEDHLQVFLLANQVWACVEKNGAWFSSQSPPSHTPDQPEDGHKGNQLEWLTALFPWGLKLQGF